MESSSWRPITERKFNRETDHWIRKEDLDTFELHFLMQIDMPYNGDALRHIRFYKDVHGRFYIARESLKSRNGLYHLMPLNANGDKEGMAVIGSIMLLALGGEINHGRSPFASTEMIMTMFPLVPLSQLVELAELTTIRAMENLEEVDYG